MRNLDPRTEARIGFVGGDWIGQSNHLGVTIQADIIKQNWDSFPLKACSQEKNKAKREPGLG